MRSTRYPSRSYSSTPTCTLSKMLRSSFSLLKSASRALCTSVVSEKRQITSFSWVV
ncbi:MAG: hypothetical protein ACLRSE_11700 [Alistipes finegoldii]